MKKRYGRIAGWGSYVPPQIVTNHDLERTLNTSHDWIVQRTGIEQRRIAGPNETTATMSVNAAKIALDQADLTGADIGLIIVATSSPDQLVPPVSSLVQHALGATDVPAFVLTTGCTGWVYGLSTAYQFVENGTYDNVLVIGTELITRFVDWEDRRMAVLFGDGSGAVIVQACDEPCGLLGFSLGSDGSQAEHLFMQGGGAVEPANQEPFERDHHFVKMNGKAVFRFASRIVGRACREALDHAGLTMDDIDWVVPHQANLRIIQAAARDMKLPLERFHITVDKFGNTSASSIPMAVCDGMAAGKIKKDDTLLMVSFGAGLTWSAAVLQPVPKRQPMVANALNENGHVAVGRL